MDRCEQRDRHCKSEDPPGGREHRHVHVVEHEDLISQHRQPVEVVGPFLMSDRRDRRLQLRDMGLESDRDLVAESALNAHGHRGEEPRRRR